MLPRAIRPIHYIAYGVTDIFGAGSMAVVAGWILFFYTSFCGLTAVEASGIFAIARLFDALWTPLVGHISDHLGATRLGRRFGRRRVFLLGAIPFLPSFAFMWVSGHSYLYYLCTYVFFELVYASVLVPYGALAPEMTDDYRKMSVLTGVRMLFAQISAILAGILPKLIIDNFGGKDSPDTFLYMGIIFCVLFMLVLAMTFALSWERAGAAATVARMDKSSLAGVFINLYRNAASTLRIRSFRLHLGMYLCGYISQDIFNAVFTYFVVFALAGSVAKASTMMGTMAFAQLVAVVGFIPLILRYQPAPSYRLGCGLYILGILGLVCLWGWQPGNLTLLLYGPVLVAGLGRGGLNFIPWNIYNYMADVDEIVTGERREGIFAGVMVFTRKTVMAAAVVLVGFILDRGGFAPHAAAQSAMARDTIVALLGAGPVLLLVLGILISLRFKLTGATHAVLISGIARFKLDGDAPASPDDRRIVENLTGWPYAKLWGRNTVARPKGRTVSTPD